MTSILRFAGAKSVSALAFSGTNVLLASSQVMVKQNVSIKN